MLRPSDLTCYGDYSYTCTEIPYMNRCDMETISVNQFRDNLKSYVEQAVSTHEPIKVTRRAGESFVVISAEDWEREQESLYVLQNNELMRQITDSLATHSQGKGHKPTDDELNEITGI